MKPQATKQLKTLKIAPAQEIKLYRRIMELTNSELDLTSVLQETVSVVNETTKADSVFVYLYDDKKENLVLLASKTPHKKELGKLTLRLGEGLTGWAAQENQPVVINEHAYSDSRFKTFDVLPEDKYEAFLAVPILYKRKPIGVINIQHKHSHEYAAESVQLLSVIASHLSGVIENARLFDESKKKVAQLDSLMKVSQSITSRGYLDEILNLIVVVTAEMLNSKICSIMLLDEKGRELMLRATQSLSDAYKRKPNVSVEGSVIGAVIKTKQPVQIYDVKKEQRYAYRAIAEKEDLTSMLVVPMIVKDKAIGIINIYTQKPHFFSDEEIHVLQIVANQAAIAIENTRLMEESLKAKEALETRKVIERAKGILMRMSDLDEDSAYKLIHKKSMDSCKPMKEIAESIILMDDLRKGQ
jgi:signal transduction protein with GAF and PtsI domain